VKRLLPLLLLLACATAPAVQKSFTVTATGGAPIPVAYSASDAASLVMTGLFLPKTICVYNATASKIAWSEMGTATVAPASTPEIYVAPSTSACLSDPSTLGAVTAVYIRSASGAAITTTDVWGFAR
jgi:hypothetical protein